MQYWTIYLDDVEVVTFEASEFAADDILQAFNESRNWESNYVLEKTEMNLD